ncbi:MAG: TonB-dependent receptor, partial [Ignavibacteria bacterium]|nr:TonB-dependent receptor [Ignavibacteria bacterium]
MVKNINFSAGGFSAEYGNALSSIMNVEYDKGNKDIYSTKVDLSMIDLALLTQGPITNKGSFTLGIRKSYLGMLLRLGAPPEVHADYYDIQSVLNYQLSNSDIITATTIYSKDNLSQDPTVSSALTTYDNSKINNQRTNEYVSESTYKSVITSYYNTLLAVKYDKIFHHGFLSQTVLSWYDEIEDENMIGIDKIDHSFNLFQDRFIRYSNDYNALNKLKIQTLSLKQGFTFAVSPFYAIKAGLSYKKIFYDIDQNKSKNQVYSENITKYPNVTSIIYLKDPVDNDTTIINISSFRSEGYLENIFQLSESFLINAGGRLDYFDMNKETKFSPRIGLSYNFPFELVLRLSWGIFYQPPTYKQLRFSENTAQNTSYQKSIHYIAGLEKNFSSDVSCQLEYYHKLYSDLLPVSRVTNSTLQYRTKENNTEGYATGFDFQFIGRFPS